MANHTLQVCVKGVEFFEVDWSKRVWEHIKLDFKASEYFIISPTDDNSASKKHYTAVT